MIITKSCLAMNILCQRDHKHINNSKYNIFMKIFNQIKSMILLYAYNSNIIIITVIVLL